jgi:hypothetical protein
LAAAAVVVRSDRESKMPDTPSAFNVRGSPSIQSGELDWDDQRVQQMIQPLRILQIGVLVGPQVPGNLEQSRCNVNSSSWLRWPICSLSETQLAGLYGLSECVGGLELSEIC